jgi:mono/diheme cytochrome c family protein
MKATRFLSLIFTAPVMAFSLSAWGQVGHTSHPSAAAAGVFNAYCAVCHGTDGTGSPTGKSLNAPDLRSAAVQRQSSAALERFIREGKDRMPSFKGQLTAEQIADEAAYIHSFGHRKTRQ